MTVPVVLDCSGMLQMMIYQFHELSAIRGELGCLRNQIAQSLPDKSERINRTNLEQHNLAQATQCICQVLVRLSDQLSRTSAPPIDIPQFLLQTIEDCPTATLQNCDVDTVFCPIGHVNYQGSCVPASFEFQAPAT